MAEFTHDQPLEVDLAEKSRAAATQSQPSDSTRSAASTQQGASNRAAAPAPTTDRVGYLLEEGLPAAQPTATTGYQKKKRRSVDQKWRKAAAPPVQVKV